jgi:hypothetical protein
MAGRPAMGSFRQFKQIVSDDSTEHKITVRKTRPGMAFKKMGK